MTDQMGINVLKIFPDLKKAVLRRRLYARFSTLNQMINVINYKKEKMDIISFIKKEGYKVLIDFSAPIRDKIAILLLFINEDLYEFIWKKIKNRY